MVAQGARPRVFVSYAHDTEDHKARVLRLCQLLRDQGVDAWLDAYDVDVRQDWYAWYVEQIAHADFVLVIASPNYRAAGDGRGDTTRSRGVRSEATLLRDLLHADRPAWTRRILPVVLPGGSIDEIPLFLQPHLGSRYLLPEISASGIENLLRTITGQVACPPPALGDIPVLPPGPVPEAPEPPESPDPHRWMHVEAAGNARVYQAGRDQYINQD